MGNKELGNTSRCGGYATAADWVYGHAIQPGAWTDGDLISLADVRHIHTLDA